MGRRTNTDRRRAQIIDGLIEVMAERGYEGASVAAIAARAGLTAGLLHYHFDSKLQVLLAAAELLQARHLARLDELLAARVDPVTQLRAFVDLHLATGDSADPKSLACWTVLGAEALRQPQVQQAYRRTLELVGRRLASIIDRGVAAGLFLCPDRDAATAALIAAIQGYYLLATTARALIPRGSAADATWRMARGLLGLPADRSA